MKDIQKFLDEERGKQLSQTAIRYHLKKTLRYSKKKASKFNA